MSVLDRVFLLWIRRFVSRLYLDGFGSRFNAPHRVTVFWGYPPLWTSWGQGGTSWCRLVLRGRFFGRLGLLLGSFWGAPGVVLVPLEVHF